jgi:histidinol-phosphatase (PHP family)
VRSGLCDIISHLDVPKRSGRIPGRRGLEELNLTLQEIARADLCIEINTSGYRHADLEVKETYPALSIVEQAMKLNIPFIVNSDAHAPDQVGLKFGEIESLLREKGCRQLARFKQRRREMYPL